jgi:GntR family transcriptional regulator / MocR family aminotransferase
VSVGPIGVAPVDKGRWPDCFVTGAPDASQFPFDLWARLLARSWRRPGTRLPSGGDAGGYPELRAAIAAYLGEARGIRCEPDHVLVVTGIRQAVDLTCRLLLDPGDQVWMENPGYPGIRAILAANGAEVAGIPVDDEGIDVAAGRKAVGKARLCAWRRRTSSRSASRCRCSAG